MPAKWQVARIVGHFVLDPGPVQSRMVNGDHGPFVMIALPGGDVALLAQDPMALGRLASVCAHAQSELRTAQARHALLGRDPRLDRD
jgi:hypothetical protein